MGAVAGDNGELKVAVEGCRRYRLPHALFLAPLACLIIDLDQPCGLRRASPRLIQVKASQAVPARNSRHNNFGAASEIPMLRAQDNETITQTGPGTPMGQLFRRYWTPALLAEDCPPMIARRCA